MSGRILLVDDSSFARQISRGLLEGAKYQVFEAANGDDAIKQYKDLRPDAVVLDLHMPDRDGFSVLEELKSIDPNVRIVVQTSDAQAEVREKFLAAGALDLVPKMVKRNQLLEVLSNVL